MPETFDIGGVTWSILKDNKSLDEGQKYGDCTFNTSTIRYQDISDVKDMRKYDAIMTTIWHEITHAILDSLGENDLSRNESFIKKFSTLLYQVIKTLK